MLFSELFSPGTLIQAVHSREELVYFTTLFRACQELFSSFPAPFQARNPVFRPLFHKSRPLRRTHSVYHARTRLSSTFFSSNPKVRPASARSLPALAAFFVPASQALRYNTSSCPLCQAFSIFSLCFFLLPLSTTISALSIPFLALYMPIPFQIFRRSLAAAAARTGMAMPKIIFAAATPRSITQER